MRRRWLIALGLLLAACFGAPIITAILGVDPLTIDPDGTYAAPSSSHWLGTDDLGRDVLARLLHGGRVSLFVGLVATILCVSVGATLGLMAGYFGGSVDGALMRLVDIGMGLPRLPLLLALLVIDPAKLGFEALGSIGRLIIVSSLIGWMGPARMARALALAIRERRYIEAARASGASTTRILFAHLLPNAAGPLIVAATTDVGEFIILESVLSFLGLGVQPPVPSWGAMLRNGFSYAYDAPLLLILPGLATFVTVAVINLVGDDLRDALDPRSASG